MVDSEHGSADPMRAELAQLMRRFGLRMRHRFHEVVSEHELTPPLFGALQALDDPRPMRDVADHLSCDASYVTGIADRLEAMGLVERQPQADDRRVKHLALTAAGRAVRAAVLEKMEQPHDLFPELDDAEVRAMVHAYRKLLDPTG